MRASDETDGKTRAAGHCIGTIGGRQNNDCGPFVETVSKAQAFRFLHDALAPADGAKRSRLFFCQPQAVFSAQAAELFPRVGKGLRPILRNSEPILPGGGLARRRRSAGGGCSGHAEDRKKIIEGSKSGVDFLEAPIACDASPKVDGQGHGFSR